MILDFLHLYYEFVIFGMIGLILIGMALILFIRINRFYMNRKISRILYDEIQEQKVAQLTGSTYKQPEKDKKKKGIYIR